MLRIIFIGDVVGTAGIKMIQRELPRLRQELQVDFCVANGENAAGGLGITGSLAQALYKAGIDCITLGNHTWSKWEINSWIDTDKSMLRPGNGGKNWSGQSCAVFDLPQGKIMVTQILGQVFMESCESPFDYIDRELTVWKQKFAPNITLVDFHAEATAEKQTMGYFLDGRVTAVLGTHTHVQTADEHILTRGTAYITDVGMTGPGNGVIGMRQSTAMRRFVDHLPARYELADGKTVMQAVFIEADPSNGKASNIERIFLRD